MAQVSRARATCRASVANGSRITNASLPTLGKIAAWSPLWRQHVDLKLLVYIRKRLALHTSLSGRWFGRAGPVQADVQHRTGTFQKDGWTALDATCITSLRKSAAAPQISAS